MNIQYLWVVLWIRVTNDIVSYVPAIPRNVFSNSDQYRYNIIACEQYSKIGINLLN